MKSFLSSIECNETQFLDDDEHEALRRFTFEFKWRLFRYHFKLFRHEQKNIYADIAWVVVVKRINDAK